MLMKKILYLICLISISLVSASYSNCEIYGICSSINKYSLTDNIICYQETANISSDCGGLNAGHYSFLGDPWTTPGNLYDGDWDTSTSTDGAATLLINYSIPEKAVNANWQVKDSVGITNLTIPSGCFYSPIQLKVESFMIMDWYCYNYNASGWSLLRSEFDFMSSNIYEESIIWNISKTNDYLNRLTILDNLINPSIYYKINVPNSKIYAYE